MAPLVLLARSLLGKPAQSLAACQLGPDGRRPDTGRRPKGQQVVEQVGALADQLGLVAADALDQRLDRLLAQLLGDLLATAAEQAGGVGGLGIGALAAVDHGIEPVEHVLDGDNALPAPLQRLLLGFLLLGHLRGTLWTPLERALPAILRQN